MSFSHLIGFPLSSFRTWVKIRSCFRSYLCKEDKIVKGLRKDSCFVFLQLRWALTQTWIRRLTSSLPSSVNRELSPGCQVVDCFTYIYIYCYTPGDVMTQNFSLLTSVSATQDVFKPKSKQVSETAPDFHRPRTTGHPTSQSVTFTSTAPPTTTTNHTTAPLGNPVILPYPSNDQVFIGKSFSVLKPWPNFFLQQNNSSCRLVFAVFLTWEKLFRTNHPESFDSVSHHFPFSFIPITMAVEGRIFSI